MGACGESALRFGEEIVVAKNLEHLGDCSEMVLRSGSFCSDIPPTLRIPKIQLNEASGCLGTSGGGARGTEDDVSDRLSLILPDGVCTFVGLE